MILFAQKSVVDCRLNDGDGDDVDEILDRFVIEGFFGVVSDLIRIYCVLESDANLPA